ncbi:hypothetical protein BH11PAT1_BH11PAT1_4020 [soil metagenome]
MKHTFTTISLFAQNFKELLTEKRNRTFILLYFLLVILLFLYSFTQVDLGLTITRNQVLFNIERSFQYIGYFNRTLSAILFIILMTLLFIFHGIFLRKVTQKKLSLKHIIGVLVFITPFLAFPYNAFSYDVFNYIFDAKIITFYHQNPYIHSALDFPTDPMLAFMHWTHRVYPYGPVWLALTVPLSLLGLQYFIPTLILFKLLTGGAFLLTVIGIGKIVEKLQPSISLKSIAFFALSPLVLIESLISAHNDIVMMAFAIWAVYYLVSKRFFWAFVLLFLSIGIKFATIFLLPLFCIAYLLHRKQKSVPWEKFFLFCLFVMILAVGAASYRTTFQPWYLLYVIPFATLLVHRAWITVPVSIVSLVALLNYVPFLYLGNWDPPIPLYLFWFNCTALGISMLIGLSLYIFQRQRTVEL